MFITHLVLEPHDVKEAIKDYLLKKYPSQINQNIMIKQLVDNLGLEILVELEQGKM
jgi:hypothetical protein